MAIPTARGATPQSEVRLSRDYFRCIARLEAMPENASGADETWVHNAHVGTMRHLRSAKR